MSLAKCRRHFPLWRQAVCHQRSNKKIQMGPKTKLLNTGVITRSLLLLPPPPPPPPSFFLFLFYFKQIFLFDFLPYTFFFSLSLLLLSSYLSACVCVCTLGAPFSQRTWEDTLYVWWAWQLCFIRHWPATSVDVDVVESCSLTYPEAHGCSCDPSHKEKGNVVTSLKLLSTAQDRSSGPLSTMILSSSISRSWKERRNINQTSEIRPAFSFLILRWIQLI